MSIAGVFNPTDYENLQKVKTNTENADLGKDQFLNILVAQLQHQDPMSPLEDKDFIAQMAQFSSLEQMNALVDSFDNLAAEIKSGNNTSTEMNTSITAMLEQLKNLNESFSELTEQQEEQLEIINREAEAIQELINLNKAKDAYE